MTDPASGAAPDDMAADGTGTDDASPDTAPDDARPGEEDPEETAASDEVTGDAGDAAAHDDGTGSAAIGPGGTASAGTGAGGTSAEAPPGDVADRAAAGETVAGEVGRRRAARPVMAGVLAWTTTGLAALLVFTALVLPDKLTLLRPVNFLTIPVEALLLGALLLVLPPRARRVVAALSGVGIALLTIVKLLDMGFYSVLGTPFDLLFDWGLIPDGTAAFSDSAGHTIAVVAEILVMVLVVALLVLTPLAVMRLARVTARHTRTTARALVALGVVWVIGSALTVWLPDGPRFATRNTAALAYENVQQMRADLRDQKVFKKAVANDPFATTPPDRLLTALRGKNVIFAFVESYGRCAVQDPVIAPGVDAMLANETAKLTAAGYSSRSAFLTSATYGGSSWLGHSTFLSGLWIDNQSRYRTLIHSKRMPLTALFQRTGAWRTVGVVPGTRKTWPEGSAWERLEHIYDAHHLGYKGPNFGWSTMPDQYTLTAYQRLENGRPHDKPLMSEIILTSSHEPWAPIPKTVPWNQVGDGSVYYPIKKAGKNPRRLWKHPRQVRAEYGRTIQYSVSNLVDFVLKYESKDTVLVFLGDHQPAPIVSGNGASHDVPVAIVAKDPDVMKRISGWGWQDGLRPDPKTAPVWKMSAFRDRFLTAYGPQPGSASPAPVSQVSGSSRPAR